MNIEGDKSREFLPEKGLKVIFTRIKRQSTLSHFESIGVETKDNKGDLLSPMGILHNYVELQKHFDEATRNLTAELVAGIFHIETFIKLIDNIVMVRSLKS